MRTVLVTGASSGFGKAIAELFSKEVGRLLQQQEEITPRKFLKNFQMWMLLN
jgi:short-subunit dehydrogenase